MTDKNNIFINSIFSKYKVPSDDFTYIYRGLLTTNISDSLLELIEYNFKKHQLDSLTFKKVYFILVEILQNVTKYQEKNTEYTKNSIVIIQRISNKYFLTVGNLIKNEEKENLSLRIDKINSLDSEELNEYYKHVLLNGKYNKKGGAGLGLINIKRRSKHDLNYSFSKINEEYSYFYFNSIVALKDNITREFSFETVKNTHKIFKNDKISLLFSNIFNQDKLKGLIQFLEQSIQEKLQTEKKILNVLIEVLQNVIYHSKYEKKFLKEKFGVFLMSENENTYKLEAGNYIQNNEITGFKKKLEIINKFSIDELEKAYLKELKEVSKEKEESNLGILDIRLRSNNFLNFNFQKVNDDYSFFTIEVNIDK